MAETLCQLKKKGGGGEFKETVLWTNSSPTSQFNGQTVTLSTSISSFDFLKFKWRLSTTTATEGTGLFVNKDDFVNMLSNTTSPKFGIGAYLTSTDKSYLRGIYYSSDTKVGFNSCYGLGDSSVNNLNIIPLQIIGLKH